MMSASSNISVSTTSISESSIISKKQVSTIDFAENLDEATNASKTVVSNQESSANSKLEDKEIDESDNDENGEETATNPNADFSFCQTIDNNLKIKQSSVATSDSVSKSSSANGSESAKLEKLESSVESLSGEASTALKNKIEELLKSGKSDSEIKSAIQDFLNGKSSGLSKAGAETLSNQIKQSSAGAKILQELSDIGVSELDGVDIKSIKLGELNSGETVAGDATSAISADSAKIQSAAQNASSETKTKTEIKSSSDSKKSDNNIQSSSETANIEPQGEKSTDSFSSFTKNEKDGEKQLFKAGAKNDSLSAAGINVNANTNNGVSSLSSDSVTTINIKESELTNTITKLATSQQSQNSGVAKMVLNIDSLGTVFVRIDIKDGAAKLRFTTDTKDSQIQLETHLAALGESLGKNGIRLSDASVELRDNQYQQNAQNQDSQSRGSQNEFRKNSQNFDFSTPSQAEESIEDDSSVKSIRQGSLIEEYI